MRLGLVTGKGGFRSFFWTQFWGAFNDNFFKNALIVMITFRGVQVAGIGAEQVVALAGGLFIAPFFFFSAFAGQLADRYEKSKIVRLTKLAEIVIMVIASLGFALNQYGLLLFVLFLMGTQSAFFGPVKYSVVPDLVAKDELTTGNAFIEAGTFISILLGTLAGGWVSASEQASLWLSLGLVVVSILGYICSRGVPVTPVGDPNLDVKWNPLPEFRKLLKLVVPKVAVFNSILAISWFWFFGSGILSVLPIYVRDYLQGDEHVVTLFLAMFTLGIGLGSVLCEKLSFKKVEIGLVPIGSLGMTIFIFDLFLIRPTWAVPGGAAMTIEQFITVSAALRLLVDFFLMSVFGGFFILPLFTLLQERSEPETRSRVISANNIFNALFMVGGSVLVLLFYHFKLNTAQIFAVFGTMNVVVAIYIYTVVPEFTLRFYTWLLSNIMYRVRVEGLENIPSQGPVILAANHVTFVDWLILSGACKRPARFVMYYKFFNIPVAKYILRQAKVIPIASAKENPKILEESFLTMQRELNEGEVICIFPEGKLTATGKLNPFRPGLQRILSTHPVPVVPVVLEGLWGSLFSRKKGKERPHRRRILVKFLPPMEPAGFRLEALESSIARELGETPPHLIKP
ncbi:MAG: MFS transporter [Bdellovibrionales bacterium]